MKSIYRFMGIITLITLLMCATVLAQRPRSISEPETPTTTTTNRTLPPAPSEVKVKYEGGILGYRKKIDGTLTLDDQNSRVLFRDQTRREIFSIPYESISAAFADTKSKRPTAASVLGSLSIYTLPAQLIRKKFRYLTVQFNDPDTHVSGITSFKMQNKEILESVLNTLANKAGLTPRGEVFVRKDSTAGKQQSTPE